MKSYQENYDTLVSGYVAAMLFSTSVETDESDEVYLDSLVSGIEDFSPVAKRQIYKKCHEFLCKVNKKGFTFAEEQFEQAGMDFYYTCNGHGVGFWDRPEIYGADIAKILTEIADSFPEDYVFFDQDENVIHID